MTKTTKKKFKEKNEAWFGIKMFLQYFFLMIMPLALFSYLVFEKMYITIGFK